MNKTVQTIKVGGGADYAKVAERIKAFREDCPNGLTETTPTFLEKNMVMFKARALKDKANAASAEATAHATGENKDKKAFEKLESIAVGRALAMLGYLASGEIASSEEMEEFMEQKEGKRQEAMLSFQADVEKIATIEDLRVFYKENKGKGKEFDAMIMNRKNQLTPKENANS